MPLKFCFVLDPVSKLDLEWDSSLFLLRELHSRGHETEIVTDRNLWAENHRVMGYCSRATPRSNNMITLKKLRRIPLDHFNAVILRKDPPFDMGYLYLTHLLELLEPVIPVMNHPRGVRDANEKLAILNFPDWIPDTCIAQTPEMIGTFQRRIKDDIVLKPLHSKGGEGVALIRYRQKSKKTPNLLRYFKTFGPTVMAQRFISGPEVTGDKRIMMLNGEFLCAYEKQFRKGEFRANLSLGGTWHPTRLTPLEKKMLGDLRPYLLSKGLYLAGLDVMQNKLLEINVTSPAGISESQKIYPGSHPVRLWADFVESLARRR